MATEPHQHTWEDRFAERFARVGAWASIMAALILSAVIVANAFIIILNIALGALLLLAQFGPPISSAISLVGTGATHYTRLRILRGKEKFSLKDELVDKALDAPGNLQNAPEALARRLGCFSSISTVTLLASLVVWFLTSAPQPWGVLGYAQNGGFRGPAVAAVQTATPAPVATHAPTATPIPPTRVPPTATPKPQPTATFTPTPVPVIVFKVTQNQNYSESCYYTAQYAPSYTITLDNTGSNVPVTWSIGNLIGANGPVTWAAFAPQRDTIPAGKTEVIQVTNVLCQTNRFAATITYTGGGTITITDSVTVTLG